MRALIFLFLFIPFTSSAQIHIDKAGDFWEKRVDSALCKIKLIDSIYYSHILMVCDTISFWNGNYSTCSGSNGRKGSIVISAADAKFGDINDLCAVLVHESLHLRLMMIGKNLDPYEEEILCYSYERDFLMKIPGVSYYLIKNAEIQISKMESKRTQYPANHTQK